MKILFAAPDRDLLECYRKLLEKDFGEIVTAFDGTQVLSVLSNETFDIAVIDESIPRIDFKTLISHIKDKELPVIILTNEPLGANRLKKEEPEVDFLSYPFSSQDLIKTIKYKNRVEKGLKVDSDE